MIIMVHGLPGTGKSFLARQLSQSTPNSVVLKTVSLRQVRGQGPELFDENDKNTREDKDNSYKVLCEVAEKALQEGKTPILDATFHKKYRRQWVYDLANKMNAKLAIISVSCDEALVFERLKRRKEQKDEDAFLNSIEAYAVMKQQQDPLGNEGNIIQIDPSKEKMDKVLSWLEQNFK